VSKRAIDKNKNPIDDFFEYRELENDKRKI
jgi:hypothetical protein